MLATHGSPNQCTVPGIELLDAAVGFDDLWPGYADTSLLRNRERRAASSDKTTAAVATGASAKQTDHRYTSKTCLDERTHDLGNRQLAGVGFLQAHAAGIEQDQHGH